VSSPSGSLKPWIESGSFGVWKASRIVFHQTHDGNIPADPAWMKLHRCSPEKRKLLQSDSVSCSTRCDVTRCTAEIAATGT
jgi:hypothetical protein